MTSSALDNLVRIGQLKVERASQALALEATDWRILDQAHRKRNLAEYEGEVDIDQALLEALLRVARTVAERVTTLGPVQE